MTLTEQYKKERSITENKDYYVVVRRDEVTFYEDL